MKHRTLALALAFALTGCGTQTGSETGSDAISGAKSALFSQKLFPEAQRQSRPGAVLGIFVQEHLDSALRENLDAAMEGIRMQFVLAEREEPLSTDRAFLVLQEFGALLQVDVSQMLNQSNDRPLALNQYTDGLSNGLETAQTVLTELEERLDILDDRIRELKKDERSTKREVRTNFKEEDFAAGGIKQNELSEIELQVAKMESEEDKLDALQKHYEDMIEIAEERLSAIAENREVLIAGLRVVDIPGIEDLDILDKPGRSFFNR